MRFSVLSAVAGGACLLISCGGESASSPSTAAASSSPSAVSTRDPGNVNCPKSVPARPGLDRFGAYIGTWQVIHTQDPQYISDYTITGVPGHIVARCSTDNYVIAEEIFLDSPTSASSALALGVNELPGDQKQIYDHTHSGCRTVQYQSQQIAQQLGPDDNDGRAAITLEGAGAAAYDSAAVSIILIDELDALGNDQGC